MASLVFMLRCLCLSYLTNLVCSVDCSAQPPVQRASKGRPVKLTGLSISHEISEEELDLSIQASSGSVRLLLLDGLQLLEGGGSHSVAVRATLPLLQAALEQVQYTSCTDCSAVLDSIQLTCASPNNMQSEAIVQMEIDSVLPYLRAASLYREIKNYTAHVFRDVSLEYAMYSGILQLNITSSSGTVAVEHDWDAPGAILKGTAAEVAWILKSSGVTFKPNRSQTFDHLVNLQLCLTDETGAPVSECITLSLKVLGLEVAAVVDEELKVGGEPDTAVASAVASVASVESHILHVWMPAADEMPHLEPCESTGVDEVWFRIQEDVWEAPICIDLRGDADESATYVDLQVSVSTGMVHCDAFAGRRAGIFTTRCAGTSSDPSFPSLASCEVGAEVALRPTRGEVRECLRHLVFTPPSNFDGEVLMRITVAFVDVFGAEPRKIIQESKIQVEAVNDMPWLYWVTLPPQEMLNNESFPFRGIRVYDPDVVGWRAERAESFTLTFQTLVGEILFPLGEPLWQEQVPAPPYPSRYLRLQGTLQQIQESFNRVLYKPPGWFAGEDEVFVRVSDGGLEGGRNLTGELAFRVTVLQARLPVGLIVKTAALKSKEDEAFWFGQAGGIHIDFPAPEPKLYLKISSTDGALLLDEMVHLSFGSVLSSSTTRLEVIGSMAVLDTLLQEVRWKHPNRDWVSPPAQPAKIELQACQWDLDLKVTMADTCSTRALTVEVEPVDDTPVLFSLNHPWALPLHVQQDTPKSLCCFKIHDIDLRSTGAVGAPWPFAMRIMAKYGNISMAVSEQVILTEAERNLIGLQGSAADLEDVLNTLSYTPPAQMTHRHGLDHLCLFLRDISSSLRVGNIRRYTGCWDIDIEPAAAPVPPPPAQPQPRSSQREVPCDFNIQNDSENETCERLTDLPRRPPPVMFNREEREENISCNDRSSAPHLPCLQFQPTGQINSPTFLLG
ncbi:unnamed protein product [Durusdinium trenchii]|uniref:Uncharacterized protein n=1 Tax=Durusdinium trenchii TaxID=1381693 RepID=A0ABP0Q4T0_9DINO